MQKHFASPVEEVVLAGIEVRGGLVIVGRLHILAVLLIDLPEEVAQLAGVLDLHQFKDHAPGRVSLAEEEIGHGEIVAIVVSVRTDLVGALQIRLRLRQLSRLNVELGQIVVGVVIPGLQLDGFAELLGRQFGLPRAHQGGAQVDASFGQFGLDLRRRS